MPLTVNNRNLFWEGIKHRMDKMGERQTSFSFMDIYFRVFGMKSKRALITHNVYFSDYVSTSVDLSTACKLSLICCVRASRLLKTCQ